MITEIIKISLIAYVVYALREPHEFFHWYHKVICRLPWYLCRPLGGCYICFAGQTCFWYYVITHWGNINLIDLGFYPAAGITLSLIFHKLYTWAK